MTVLKELELVEYQRPNGSDPKLKRRQKLRAKIDEQINLAENANYQPATFKWVDGDDGQRQRIQVPKRVKRWWGKDAAGATVLTIRYGSRPLELAKGKQAIKLKSDDDLVPTLKRVAEAVEAGELDGVIEQHAGVPKLKLSKHK